MGLIDSYRLASEVEYLQHASERYATDSDGQGIEMYESLSLLGEILRSSSFDSSISSQVHQISNRVQEDLDENGEISTNTSDRIHQLATTWERVLKEELKRKTTVPVPPRGIFDTSRLVESPGSLFSDRNWERLDDTPKRDIVESCRNLAIGSSTSSVMMSLRAVEHCLRQWYEAEKGEELNQAWGAVLGQLMREFADEDKSKATILDQLSDLPPVLSNLYYLKDKRNEVNHPDKSPDIDEAQRTLMVVVATITDILDEIEPDESESGIRIELTDDYSDTEELVLDLIREVERESKKSGAPKEAIIALGEQYGLSSEEVDTAVTENMMRGKIYEPKQGVLKVI